MKKNISEIFLISCSECKNPDVAATRGKDMVPIAIESIRKTPEHFKHTLEAKPANRVVAAALSGIIDLEPTRITTYERLDLD